jgi:chromosome segregation ATPase
MSSSPDAPTYTLLTTALATLQRTHTSSEKRMQQLGTEIDTLTQERALWCAQRASMQEAHTHHQGVIEQYERHKLASDAKLSALEASLDHVRRELEAREPVPTSSSSSSSSAAAAAAAPPPPPLLQEVKVHLEAAASLNALNSEQAAVLGAELASAVSELDSAAQALGSLAALEAQAQALAAALRDNQGQLAGREAEVAALAGEREQLRQQLQAAQLAAGAADGLRAALASAHQALAGSQAALVEQESSLSALRSELQALHARPA